MIAADEPLKTIEKRADGTLKSSICFVIYTWRCSRFCHTAFSSGVGVRRTMIRLREPFLGVRVRSGVQWAVGLSASLPFGSIVIRNSVAKLGVNYV